MLTARFIAVLAAIAFLASPFLGYGISVLQTQPDKGNVVTLTPPDRTKEDLQAAIDKDWQSVNPETRYPESKVVSFSKKHSNWYIVVVEQKIIDENHDTQEIKRFAKTLVGDFYNSADRMIVVIQPDKQLFRKNISYGVGIPYDVIDEMNIPLDNGENNNE